jgi:2-methylisocitrate lyase-like PEP mutase family enzyme
MPRAPRGEKLRGSRGRNIRPPFDAPGSKVISLMKVNTQAEKGLAFRALHERDRAFLIPNPWDVGTARLLAHLGFEALATTSAGYAFSVGQRDNTIGRAEMMAHVAAIASATDLPVSADLGNGFGHDPETVAETIRIAANAGVVGASIEDASGDDANDDATGGQAQSIYIKEQAVERIRAAAEVTRSLPFVFTLTARCENYLVGRPDLKDTIHRLQAYREAGADVLYAPGLTKKEDIASLVSSVDRPVNVLMALQGVSMNLTALSELGVKRVSVGSARCRAALTSFLNAAREMQQHGTFSFAEESASFRDISSMFS